MMGGEEMSIGQGLCCERDAKKTMNASPTKDCAYFWVDHDLGGLECLSATYVSHRFAPHAHEEFVIGVIQAGAQRVRLRGGHEVLPEHTMCVINPGELHTGHAATEAGWSYRVIYPHPSLLIGIAEQLTERRMDIPYFREIILRDQYLASQFFALHAALECDSSTSLAKESLLTFTLGQMILRYARPRSPKASNSRANAGILRAQELLRAEYNRPVGLNELAKTACMSPYHFLRSFSARFGISPHVYQLQQRVAAAKRLLSTDLALTEVADQTGFVDQSHLTNRFKAVVGVTPGAFRKMSKNLQDGR